MPVPDLFGKNRKEIGVVSVAIVLTVADLSLYQLTPHRFRALVACGEVRRVIDPVLSVAANSGMLQRESLQGNTALKCPGLIAVVDRLQSLSPNISAVPV